MHALEKLQALLTQERPPVFPKWELSIWKFEILKEKTESHYPTTFYTQESHLTEQATKTFNG